MITNDQGKEMIKFFNIAARGLKGQNLAFEKAIKELKEITMKDEAIKRIELAEKELKAAKEALQETLIPEYVEITGNSLILHFGKVYKVDHVYDIETGRIAIKYQSRMVFYSPMHYKPSTKEAFDKQNEIIRVPDCIDFLYHKDTNRVGGIVFNNSKQVLLFDYYNNVYETRSTHGYGNLEKEDSNFKLTKCERSDLKAGDVAFSIMSNWNLSYCIGKLERYCIILNKKEDVVVGGGNCVVYSQQPNDATWYKVEKI